MTERRSLALPWATALLAAASLSACVVVPDRGYERGYERNDAAGPVVYVAPPPPQAEYVGPPPAVGYVWISGFWAWQLGRHVWVGGHWDAPHPGYRWVPHAWYPEGRGWRLREGHWGR